MSTNDSGHYRPPSGGNLRRNRHLQIGRGHRTLTLQRRLAEHRQRQAELAAQRPLRQKSRLRRLTGDGQAAGATNGSTPATVTAGDSPLNSGVVARAAMAAAAYAAMVAALTGDFTPLAAVSGADGSSGSSNGGGTSISTSTSTSSGTN